jgi:hypothetical protein
VTALISISAVIAGCGGSSAAPGDSGADAITVETQPTPLEQGRRSSGTIRVRDAAGQPVTGAKVAFKAQHKTMSHAPDANGTAEEREPGVYNSSFLPSMSGTYRLTIAVDRPQGKSQKTLHTEIR